MVTVEITTDLCPRYCAVCKKRIDKWQVIVRYTKVMDEWRNTREWFAHINCLINRLKSLDKKAKKELKKISEINFEIERHYK